MYNVEKFSVSSFSLGVARYLLNVRVFRNRSFLLFDLAAVIIEIRNLAPCWQVFPINSTFDHRSLPVICWLTIIASIRSSRKCHSSVVKKSVVVEFTLNVFAKKSNSTALRLKQRIVTLIVVSFSLVLINVAFVVFVLPVRYTTVQCR